MNTSNACQVCGAWTQTGDDRCNDCVAQKRERNGGVTAVTSPEALWHSRWTAGYNEGCEDTRRELNAQLLSLRSQLLERDERIAQLERQNVAMLAALGGSFTYTVRAGSSHPGEGP
jgi:hypothetical protein